MKLIKNKTKVVASGAVEANNDELDPLMRLPEVLKLLPVCRSTLHRMVKRGEFPKPVRISVNAMGFSRRAVAKFLAGLAER